MNRRAFQQHRQVAFPAQQARSSHQTHGRHRSRGLAHPLRGSLHQADQARASSAGAARKCSLPEPRTWSRKAPGIAPAALRQSRRAGSAAAVAAPPRTLCRPEQFVELLGHHSRWRISLGAGTDSNSKTERGGNPAQIVVLGRQDMGLLVIEVRDAVSPGAEDIGPPAPAPSRAASARARQPAQGVQGWAGALGNWPPRTTCSNCTVS